MYRDRMPWGKHRGKTLDEIPADYLAWCLRECSGMADWLRWAIEAELEDRFAARRPPPPQPPATPPQPPQPPWEAIITRWFRELTLRHHPDRGGTHEGMVAIVDARDRLLTLLKGVRQ